MKLPMILLSLLTVTAMASDVLADPVPVTHTSKRPYRPEKNYCNGYVFRMPPQGENIACYNHDACYADPQGMSREDCDRAFLEDLRRAGLGASALVKYRAVRFWGEKSWNRSRDKDRRQAERRLKMTQ